MNKTSSCMFWHSPKLVGGVLFRFCWRESRHNRVKKNQLDAQFILSTFCQPLQVSGVSRHIWMDWNSSKSFSTTDSHLKRITTTYCCLHTVVPPDDGPRYTRNMKRLTKYIKNNLWIKLVLLYKIVGGCFVHLLWAYFSECKVCFKSWF
jgi:hypothetical protein